MSTSSTKYARYSAFAIRVARAGSRSFCHSTMRAAACVGIGNFDGIRKSAMPWKRALRSKSRFEYSPFSGKSIERRGPDLPEDDAKQERTPIHRAAVLRRERFDLLRREVAVRRREIEIEIDRYVHSAASARSLLHGAPLRRPRSIACGRPVPCGLRTLGLCSLRLGVGHHPRSQTRPSGLGFALLARASLPSHRSLIRPSIRRARGR